MKIRPVDLAGIGFGVLFAAYLVLHVMHITEPPALGSLLLCLAGMVATGAVAEDTGRAPTWTLRLPTMRRRRRPKPKPIPPKPTEAAAPPMTLDWCAGCQEIWPVAVMGFTDDGEYRCATCRKQGDSDTPLERPKTVLALIPGANNTLPAKPGEEFMLSAVARPRDRNIGPSVAFLQLTCTNSTPATSSTVTTLTGEPTELPRGDWTSLHARFTVPDGCDTITPEMAMRDFGSLDTVYVDDTLCRKVVQSSTL